MTEFSRDGWRWIAICDKVWVAFPNDEHGEKMATACTMAECYLNTLHPDKQREVVEKWLWELGEMGRSQPYDAEDMDMN